MGRLLCAWGLVHALLSDFHMIIVVCITKHRELFIMNRVKVTDFESSE